ncbi:MAG TPA: sugar phosphate isomerase/epimerase [Gemmatales bacterium]|nr:sugar phosphate isomerase/epimerase [Gemmatales bacterium]
MKLCLSSVTTLPGTLADDIAACADAGCSHLEVWLTKLETYLQGNGAWATPNAVKQLLADKKVSFIGAAYQGGLLLSQGEARRTSFDQFQKRLALCQEFGIGTLLVVPDVADRLEGDDISRVQATLAQIAELASAFDVKLALEFRGSTRWCASIPTAAALVASVGSPHLGLCLDLFHYYTGPSKLEDLGYLNKDNLFAVQLCDLSGVAREVAGDADRIFPGEGDFHLAPILQYLKQIEYTGYITVELMNPEIWKMKPTQVAEASYTCLRVQVGEAGMPTPLEELGRFD